MNEPRKERFMVDNSIATYDEIFVEGADYILKVINDTDEYKTTVNTPEEMYGAFLWIVRERNYLKINGVLVDLFTGSAVWQIIYALKDDKERLTKFLSRSVTSIVNVTWKIFNKQ